MRGFRPSRYGSNDQPEEVAQQYRETRVRAYARRARKGLPLFETHLGDGDSSYNRQGLHQA